MRTFFSTLGAPFAYGTVHSPGSKVNPYLANMARAFCSCIALFSLAVMAERGLKGVEAGLLSLMTWVIWAGTDRVGVVFALAGAGAATGALLAC